MDLLDQYFELQGRIYKYFGYVEDWVAIPLDDARDYYWYLSEAEYNGGQIHFAKSKANLEVIIKNGFDYTADGADGNDYYTNEIYTQRFLPKWVYEGPEYTMVCVDTQTDGNKFLRVYDNNKRLK